MYRSFAVRRPAAALLVAWLAAVPGLFLFAAAPVHAEGTLEKVKASGVFTVGYREASIPFSYLGGDGQPTGFGWRICGRVAERVKKVTGRSDLKIEKQAVTAQNRIPLVQNGTVDIECGSTTRNAEREKQVGFALPYFFTGTRFLVKTGAPVHGAEDLRGKRVASTTGTTNPLVLRKLNAERGLGFELLAAKDHDEAQLLVQSGRADAFGMDDILLYGLRAASPRPADWAVVGEALQVEPYAIMLRKDDPAFKKVVDELLVEMIRSGEFEALYRQWFQSPIPPKGVNLDATMSPQLRGHLQSVLDGKPAL